MKLLANLSDPKSVLDELKTNQQNISKKTINEISQRQWIKDTLQGISEWISPYIDWGFFIAWTAALILLMYNGILLMIKSWTGASEVAKIKWRFMNIAIWVIIISSIYIILRVFVWFINYIAW